MVRSKDQVKISDNLLGYRTSCGKYRNLQFVHDKPYLSTITVQVEKTIGKTRHSDSHEPVQ